MSVSRYTVVLAASLLLATLPTFAQSPPAPPQSGSAVMTEEQKAAAFKSAADAAEKAGITGPASRKMLDQADFSIEKGYVFIPKDEGMSLMRAIGNVVQPATFVGLITDPQSNWLATVNFIKDGYVKDGDAKEWNADDLLESLRKGTEEANSERRSRGFPEVEILGWIEKPAYDDQTHRLVWSAAVRRKNAEAGAQGSANYNTYLLGRDGYFSINFITPQASIEARKPIARSLLADLSFVPGKRYEDFSSSTDKVAAYGLAALIGGIALKKLGLLALGAAFVLKFAKIIGLTVVGGLAVVKRYFRRSKPEPAPAVEILPPTENTP